jgi:hypothetical protein
MSNEETAMLEPSNTFSPSINMPYSKTGFCIIPHDSYCNSKFCVSTHTREMNALKKTLSELEEAIKQKDKNLANCRLEIKFLNEEMNRRTSDMKILNINDPLVSNDVLLN